MDLKKFISSNAPTLLTSVSITGVLSTVVLAVKATPYAYLDIQNHKSEHTEVSKKDIIKLAWKHYIPAASVGVITIASILALNSVNSSRYTALAGLYGLSEKAFREYRTKVSEVVGEKKVKDISHKISEDRIRENPPADNQILIVGDGDHLVYDTFTGVYFKSTKESIRESVNNVNQIILSEMYASLNDFYTNIGLNSIQLGEDVGWTASNLIEIDFSSHLTQDGEPCLAIEYINRPIHDYYRSTKW